MDETWAIVRTSRKAKVMMGKESQRMSWECRENSLDLFIDFYERVALVCSRIPVGCVATYGQIALLCQKPRNSRQVGYALNRRLDGRNVPAHRVVNHQGYLSGAAAFATPTAQKKALQAEGVRVSKEQQVDLKKYGWKHTLEDVLEFEREFKERGI